MRETTINANDDIDMADRLQPYGTTIFSEINQLAQQYDAVNLGQGAPDFLTDPRVIEAAQRALATPHHQYAPGWGYPETRAAISAHVRRFHGLDIDPAREALVTNGATEALYTAIMGHINPGDEVILFEPFYDIYRPCVELAGGVPRFIPLRAPGWDFDPDDLAALCNAKTRAIILNTPHNPTGKVFLRHELQTIADLCQRYDLLAITDEVYEHILYDDAAHIPLASLPGMAARTITISSLGKSFTVTGWKIGWALGPHALLAPLFTMRQFTSFAVASPLQWAAADVLALPDDYFEALRALYTRKRDFMLAALAETPLLAAIPQGGYFIMVETRALGCDDDRACAEYLLREYGLATIPPGSFYSAEHRHLARHLLRLSVCKSDDTLQAAAARLTKIVAV